MPDLQDSIHLDMLATAKRQRGPLLLRLWRAVRREFTSKDIYGMEWGDPDAIPPLHFFKQKFLMPYINKDHVALEIGPGGGRWTRYLLPFKRLYVVDFYAELLAELKKNFHEPNMVFVKNDGTNFPGVEPASVDYAFSFGTFVHLELKLIEEYLQNLKAILKPGANVVVQYADKTKVMAQANEGFSDNTPEKMKAMVRKAGFEILEEDLTSLWHSSIIRFGPSV